MTLREFILPFITGLSIPVFVVLVGRLIAWRYFCKAKQVEADLNRFRTWNCHDCGREFGAESTIIFFAGTEQANTMMIEGKPFTQWFVSVCAHCKLLCCYDRGGQPWPMPGEPFDAELMNEFSRYE